MANLLAEIEKATVAVAAIGGAVGSIATQVVAVGITELPPIDPFTVVIAAVAGGVVTFVAFEVLKKVA